MVQDMVYCGMTDMVITKNLERQAIDAYLRYFDPGDVGRVLLGTKADGTKVEVDDSIARINGIEFLKSRRINNKS